MGDNETRSPRCDQGELQSNVAGCTSGFPNSTFGFGNLGNLYS